MVSHSSNLTSLKRFLEVSLIRFCEPCFPTEQFFITSIYLMHYLASIIYELPRKHPALGIHGLLFTNIKIFGLEWKSSSLVRSADEEVKLVMASSPRDEVIIHVRKRSTCFRNIKALIVNYYSLLLTFWKPWPKTKYNRTTGCILLNLRNHDGVWGNSQKTPIWR